MKRPPSAKAGRMAAQGGPPGRCVGQGGQLPRARCGPPVRLPRIPARVEGRSAAYRSRWPEWNARWARATPRSCCSLQSAAAISCPDRKTGSPRCFPKAHSIGRQRLCRSRTSPGSAWKWEHTGQQLGYTFNLLERWSPQDRYGLAPQTASLVREPYRQRLAGGSFDLAVGAWVLRGEAMRTARLAARFHACCCLGMRPVYAPYGQTAWVAGADRSVGEYFLSAQLFESRVTGGEAEPLA
ncbi:hypothetical protein LP419_38860 [Massilia sp. H-1]|nr:hypothetical protein LP419_38860 [Massilia sp. H-1]